MEREILNRQGNIVLIYVDIDDCPALQNKYGAPSIPTIVAFVNNREVDRFVGAQSQAYVNQFITNLPAPN